MKYFKTTTERTAKRYFVEPDTFKNVSDEQYPFVQKTSNGDLAAYGICPSCLNPIRLIGVLNNTKVKPHGKHTGKSIKGLADWNYEKYKYCPYARRDHYIPPNDRDKLAENDESVKALYELLRENFDRVVYVIEKKLEIRCSEEFWKRALDYYIIRKGYLYPWLTEANLPYVFAYKAMQQANCYKQRFKCGTNIYTALESAPKIKMIVNNGYGRLENRQGFIKPVFRFTAHQQKAIDGETLQESIKFCIDNNDDGETFFEKTISFDETYFVNILRKGNEENRNKKLLEYAKEKMPDLL